MIDSNLIRHYLGHLAFFTLIINFILGVSIYNVVDSVTGTNLKVIEKTIKEYNEFDLEHICKITDCQKIRTTLDPFDKNTYEMSPNGILIPSHTEIKSAYEFFNIKLDKNLNSILNYDERKLTIQMNDSSLLKALIRIFKYINIIFIFVFTIMYFRNSFNEKRRSLLSLHDKETNIQEKYINLLNENINHELNTPISILRAKLDKLQKEINSFIRDGCNIHPPFNPVLDSEVVPFLPVGKEFKSCNDCQNFPKFLIEDFPVMFQALDAINAVMERTSNWKQIKYSNGNTSIYKIIENVHKSMGCFVRNNIRYSISDKLRDIVLTGSYKNGDLQLCIMNHIKNSIEAKASVIQFEGDLIKGKLHLFVIDNGHGIKNKYNKIISPSKFEKIFDPYYSTKDRDNCERNNIFLKWLCDLTDYLDSIVNFSETKKNIKQIRGIGTYLNRTTLRNNGGDLRVVETTTEGTVFEIITAAKIKTQ